MIKILESNATEVVKDLKPELEIDDKLEPGPEPEVIAELVPLQEEIFFRSTEVEKLPNETLVDLPAEPTLELVPHLADMRISFF